MTSLDRSRQGLFGLAADVVEALVSLSSFATLSAFPASPILSTFAAFAILSTFAAFARR